MVLKPSHQAKKEEQSICLGVYNKQYPVDVTNYTWGTEKAGYLNHHLNQFEISSETLKMLKENGIAVISREAELPGKINVEAAVDYWFAKISEMIKNPQQLTDTDLSVSATIAPFEI